MSTISARLTMACAATLLALGLAACGGSTTTPSTTTAPTSSSGSATSGTSSATDSAGTKVSANTASEEEIAAALKNAGVSNPERWAEEVVEYRPYPTDDPNLTELRDSLAKYNPGQETTDKIVSALTP
jgi:DNA uptake protein ComE-like DNA-binding protein